MKIPKNTVLTAAITMVAVLICVGFGFHLGKNSEQATYSVSKYSDLSEYPELQKQPIDGSKNDPEDCSGYNSGIGNGSRKDGNLVRPFMTSGELISEDDSYGWLLTSAASLDPNCKPVKATLTTDEKWEAETSYSTVFTLPDEIFVHGSQCRARVYYPISVNAGEIGTVVVMVASKNGYVYCGFCEFMATDNLQIVYGSDHPQTAFGGEFSTWDGNRLTVNFYTSATSEHYDNRDGHAGQYGYDGSLDVDFIINNGTFPADFDMLPPIERYPDELDVLDIADAAE